MSSGPAPENRAGPSAPEITSKDLLHQFWADAYGKEVQTAATYSYTWLADQFGHICIGILVNFFATALCGLFVVGFQIQNLKYDTGIWYGVFFSIAGPAFWEWRAYSDAVKQATGRFPLDTKLLRDNAIVATAYMALGGLLGLAFHLTLIPALVISAIVVVAAVFLAPRWLRQKIIWQKASIPYLFRLADAAPNMDKESAEALQGLIDAGAPPTTDPCQVIVGGPIGSGRTSMASGIGTEFAFKNHKVRYLGLDCLLEFATNVKGNEFPNDPGPATIDYWPWSQSQVVIIDGIGPMLSASEQNREANIGRFKQMLQNDLGSIAGVLRRCHTVWVLGNLLPPPPSDQFGAVLGEFAKAVAAYCESKSPPFVVELELPPPKRPNKAILPTARLPAHVAAVKRVWRQPVATSK
jgi:hypothetical protein